LHRHGEHKTIGSMNTCRVGRGFGDPPLLDDGGRWVFGDPTLPTVTRDRSTRRKTERCVMRRNGLAVLLSIAAVAFSLALWQGRGDASMPDADPVEYKIVSARQLGIRIDPDGSGSVFNYDGAAEALNELAKEGWRYRDFLPVGANSAFLLERQD
jgi:hypothetical protein